MASRTKVKQETQSKQSVKKRKEHSGDFFDWYNNIKDVNYLHVFFDDKKSGAEKFLTSIGMDALDNDGVIQKLIEFSHQKILNEVKRKEFDILPSLTVLSKGSTSGSQVMRLSTSN